MALCVLGSACAGMAAIEARHAPAPEDADTGGPPGIDENESLGDILAKAPEPRPPLAYDFGIVTSRAADWLPITAEIGIVVDLDSGEVLWAKDPYLRRYPASLTKIMTTMVALDHATLDTAVTVPSELAYQRPGQTLMGVTPGETYLVSNLVEGMFVLSGNDAAETLGRTLVSRDQFVEEMNAKAALLGLQDTHFANPSGLDQARHYSSAYDLAVMAGFLVEHYPEVARIAATREMLIPATPGHKGYRARSVNSMLFSYPGATGLKTGFTFRAGGCMVTTAKRGGRRLLEVNLRSDRGEFFADAGRMLDYGFSVPAQAAG